MRLPGEGIDYPRELNPEQLAAVRAGDGPVLVIAAAGTGKTRTLVYRVAWLVEQGVPGERILLLTFTNKAASEMMDRARELVGGALHGMWGGTFHHVANRILRQHAELLGYRRDYSILDSDDASSLCKKVTGELGLNRDKHFPKPDVLLSLLSLAVNKNEDPRALLADRFADHGINLEDLMRVCTGYTERKRQLNAMDFDDLLVNGVRLLEQHEGVRRSYQTRFQHVLVDEFQDTNPVQARLVDLLSGGSGNLLVVGDDFQSIYAWRGADYRNILLFPEKYPQTQIYKLVTNYRSTPGILSVANKCIQGNPEQFQKELVAVRNPLGPPVLVELQSGVDQARYVIQKIQEARREGYAYSDMAVLYRAHFHAMELQLELSRSRVPHVITSGIRFFEQAHVKDALCLPRLAQNPLDELAFARVLTLLPGVGEKGVEKLWVKLGRRFRVQQPEDRDLLLRALPARGREAWQPLHDALGQVEAAVYLRNPGELIRVFMEAFYDQYAVETFDNYPRRIEDLNGLSDFCARFDSLEAFLNELALQTNLDGRDPVGETATGADAVHLSSIHQAKGLEYAVVFVLWCVEGMFPSQRAVEENDEGDAEERRLFYVTTTRAKDHLFLCAPRTRRQRDGGTIFYEKSRFIIELGSHLVQRERGSFY